LKTIFDGYFEQQKRLNCYVSTAPHRVAGRGSKSTSKMNIQLSQSAFLTVTLSSIEAYKKECYGLLLGYRTDTMWVVEYAIPYQTAERGHKAVTPHTGRDRRVRTCLGQLCNYEQLGTFHSHPAWGNCRALAKPSPEDIQTIQPGEIELIIAVNDAKRPLPVGQSRFRHTERNHVISGTVCDFSLKMATFYKPPFQEFAYVPKIRRIPLRCPHAMGFLPDLNWK
jgi:proteasome lid subunit RPN8/RPN11